MEYFGQNVGYSTALLVSELDKIFKKQTYQTFKPRSTHQIGRPDYAGCAFMKNIVRKVCGILKTADAISTQPQVTRLRSVMEKKPLCKIQSHFPRISSMLFCFRRFRSELAARVRNLIGAHAIPTAVIQCILFSRHVLPEQRHRELSATSFWLPFG